jgi:hypothetical protein
MALTAAAVVVGLGAVVVSPASAANDPCAVPVNPIVCENSKTGTDPNEWDDIYGAGDDSIQGFTTDISANIGQTVNFKISTTATSYTIDIYRLGYYGGMGARKITTFTPTASLARNQPTCVSQVATEIYDCGTWRVSASWAVPATAVSGVYFAKLSYSGGASQIPFVVRDDASNSALFFQTSDTTWQAYNTFGGSDFYQGAGNGRAYKVSYNRPYTTRGHDNGRDYLFSNEYPMIRFLERNGYDVSYTSGVDSDRRGNLIKNHKAFLSVGHDEYWSAAQRANVEAARDAGVSLAFFSGNEVYWHTRWENSVDGSGTPYRTLVCYKETWANSKLDSSTSEWTGTWRDPRFSTPANGGGRPENALTGTMFMSNHDDLPVTVSPEEGKLRLWRGTTLANLAASAPPVALAAHTVGYESDEDLDNGSRPPGLIRMSTTVGATPELLQDFGSVVAPGTTTHHLTLYRAASGALVFSAGSIQWAWGLDSQHDGFAQAAADSRMQQATVNLFADMGATAATLQSGLVAATTSTDTEAPAAIFTAPANGATVTNGAQVTVSGTASDAGGGRVAGVEVSTDGGTTWHPASGTSSWTYSFFASGVDTQAVKARAVDDSANIGQAPAALQLTLSGPSSLFGAQVPATPAVSDSAGVEVGVKVIPQSDGSITGLRFYKGTGNNGTHTGTLWSATGSVLATGTFTSETATGWQTLNLATPVSVSRDTTYIVSYYAPNGHYAAKDNFFSTADYVNQPLLSPKSQTSGGNGVYRSGHGFPNQSYGDTNYYVDVQFVAGGGAAPSVLTVSPAAGSINVDRNAVVSALFSKAVNPSSIVFTLRTAAGASVTGTTSYNTTTNTASFTPSVTLGLDQGYTATVTAQDASGTPMAAPMTWSFTTTSYDSVATLFAPNATPANASSDDPNSVNLGVKFTPSANGQVVGVRYYQGPGNVGTHTGSLYSSSGSLLARATFSSGSGTGWQTVYFSAPISVTAATTYVASYYAPNGNYAYNENYFSDPYTNGQLSAPAGTNGVYSYGADGFPNASYRSTNYWVDPLFISAGGGPGPTPTPSPTPTIPATAVSIFTASEAPAVASWDDNSSIELGVKFTSDVNGSVIGVKFYKGAQNIGTHTGSLWSASGQLLATGTFSGESATGWQTLLFSTPVAITAATTYIASYHTATGYYAVGAGTFSSAYDHVPLHVPAGGGAYLYGAGFPTASANHNYGVDVVLVPSS